MPQVSPTRATVMDLKSMMGALYSLEKSETGATVVPREVILNYKLLPVHMISSPTAKREAYRINSLLDLYFLVTAVLGKDKIQRGPNYQSSLHYQMCLTVMKDGLKEVIEIPRDHLKSTIYSECFPIWRALPFGAREQDLFASLGFSDIFIEWMRRAHSQDIRIILVSETISNATKLGTRISYHYTDNARFRDLFPELLPTASETWTVDSLHQRRTEKGRIHGEGTFDFIGVGAALQSRHYDLSIQDDLPGLDAIRSDIIMGKAIEYHQLLVGAMDSSSKNAGRDFDEIVVGNRWSHKDLNSHIRMNEPYFGFTTHSALGGCCALHPVKTPIFPEVFTPELLMRWKRRLGTYHFSCQFLNFPIDPSKAKFNMKDFRFYHFEQVGGALANPKTSPILTEIDSTAHQKRTVIRHHVVEGDIEKDVFPRYLDRYMVVDPNHGGAHASFSHDRCRHAIMVSGILKSPRRVYVLDTWAEACPIDKFIYKIFELALQWKINKIHVEAVGAQKYLIYHLNELINIEGRTRPELKRLQIVELKTSQNANAKFERIDNTIPVVERGEVWLHATRSEDFREELEAYGQKKGLIDLLDVFGYSLPLWSFDTVTQDEVSDFLNKRMAAYRRGIASVA